MIKRTDFIPMAQKIMEHVPKISIPYIVEYTFGRAISERRRVSGWFKSCHGNKSKDDSDERHLHFIGVLVGAFATLFPYTEVKAKPGQVRNPKPVHVETLHLHNAFAGLTVEEPTESEAPDVSDDTHTQGNEHVPKVASVTFEKTEDELEDDFFFAIECFLEEVQAIRSAIKETWDLYKRTGHDLVIATLTTNTAIGKWWKFINHLITDITNNSAVELIRQAEDQLELLVERPAKYPAAKFPVWSFPAIVFYDMHDSMQSSPIEMVVLPSEGVTGAAEGMCLHADWCLYHAYAGIKYYLHLTRRIGRHAQQALPAVSKDVFRGLIDERTWRSLEWTTVLRAATVMSRNTFALDEITRGIRHAFATWTVPIWVSFGMQTLLDIQDVFETSIDRPYKDLKAHLQYASKMLTKDLDFSSPFPPDGNQQEHIDRAKSILRDIHDWTIGDMFGVMLRQNSALQSHPVLGRIFNEPHYYMRNHPLRCGMLKYDTYLQLYSTGTGVESHWPSISLLAHLYAACKFSYPDDPVWPDMELFMERQDKARLFLGALPTTFKESQLKFVISNGVSPTNFAKNRRSNAPILALNNRRLFEDRSVLGQIYQDRMYKEPTTEEATELTRKLIQAIKSSRKLPERMEDTDVPTSIHSQRDWKPLEILEELQDWLVEDAIDVYADFFCMSRICMEIWTKIKAYLNEFPDSAETTSRAISITGFILNAGADWEAMLDENKAFREHMCSQGLTLPPEIVAVRQIIQDTIMALATPANRPAGWIGDRCIRRLLHVYPGAIHPLARPGSLFAGNLYLGWDSQDVEKSQLAQRLSEFMDRFEEEAEEYYRTVDAGEIDCPGCGERHNLSTIAPRTSLYICSPITKAAWNM